MRLTELSLEKYGCYLKRGLSFPDGAGLTIVYGPNEAGKSTCLEAITDFLYAIPKNTPRGGAFGYDGMRLGASIRLADDRNLTLLRRKGYGKTLSDTKGTAYDEAVLGPILGPITRERFLGLFGLDHQSLRSGGKDLFEAEGEIGRLILEAGGGLHALVGRLEAIDKEAKSLFSKRASKDVEFYGALSAFEIAHRRVREHQFSRDAYEEARKRAEGAAGDCKRLREEREGLGAKVAKLVRVLRVAPQLRKRDDLLLGVSAFSDTEGYPEGFSTRAREALAAREKALEAHEGAVKRREELKAQIDSLSVSPDLTAAEKVIKDLSDMALHVAKARGNRPNRQRDIQEHEEKLEALRRMLGLSSGTDLAERLPETEALGRVQDLANEAIERRPSLDAAEKNVRELEAKLEQLDVRIEEAKKEGLDKPLGIAAAQFATLAGQKGILDVRQRGVESDTARARMELAALGVENVEELAALCCPTADEIREEQAAREKIETRRLDEERVKREAEASIKSGLDSIAAIEAGGPVATDAAVAEARGKRDEYWRPIRAAFVEGRVEGDSETRQGAAHSFERGVSDSDVLADRRAEEAARVASLEGYEREVARARMKAAAAEAELAALAAARSAREQAFWASYRELANRGLALGALLDFSTRRKDVIELAATIRGKGEEVAVEAAQLAPALELLERTERKLGLGGEGGLAERVQVLQTAIAARDRRSADLARDLQEQREAAAKLKAEQAGRDDLCKKQEAWDAAWPDAIKALGLSAKMSPADAGKLVTEWAGARGVLDTIAEIRKRLQRMDDDEAKLKEDVAGTALELGIEVAEDPVAGAQMLKTRWDDNEKRRAQRDSLTPGYESVKVEANLAEGKLRTADEALAELAALVGVETGNVAYAAGRFDLRREHEAKIREAEGIAMEAGDQLPIETLRAELADRDLDVIRAALDGAKGRLTQIDGELETAILEEKTARDAVSAFASEKEVTRAVAERESATAEMHAAIERHLELSLASELVNDAMAEVRAERQDPLIARAGGLFAAMTRNEFVGIDTDIDEHGKPVVIGKRASGGTAKVAEMSDGTRDQLFLAFRLASLQSYGESAEPLPFVADDILVHFDDARAKATLELLAEFGKRNQVLLFTHHESVRDTALRLAQEGRANIVDLAKAA